jgi:hypothetical protein
MAHSKKWYKHPAVLLTAAYAVAWLVFVADWLWFNRFAGIVLRVEWGKRHFEFQLIYLAVFSASLVISTAWLLWALRKQPRSSLRMLLVASAAYPFCWQLAVFTAGNAADWTGWEGFDTLRAQFARFGTVAFFFIGLFWMIWIIERGSRYYDRRRMARLLADEADGGPPAAIHGGVADIGPDDEPPVWNALDINAWYYNLRADDLFSLSRWMRLISSLSDRSGDPQTRPQRKLNQSLSGLAGYSFAFLIAFLVFSNIGGCEELYEMPAGGGEQKQIAQVVKVQKIIKKKYVVNPFSAIRFKVPPIDEIKLQLLEVTKHAYKIGQGAGEGAGFAGGTRKGKVRFIRLEYTGGDWDQDFGVGADLNMLIEYGIRTGHKVNEKTESRTIGQLKNFAMYKSPPVVYLTGQRNISLSKTEIKIVNEYLVEKHGMIFFDNGGSGHFHNQVMAMMNRVLPNVRPVQIPRDDLIHRVPYPVPRLPYVAPHGGRVALGWKVDGRWVAYYHPGDIGDAWTDDHSRVPPEVWEACYQLGTNVIFYAHAEYSKWVQAQKSK